MTIKELEERTGMTRANIRFYESSANMRSTTAPDSTR